MDGSYFGRFWLSREWLRRIFDLLKEILVVERREAADKIQDLLQTGGVNNWLLISDILQKYNQNSIQIWVKFYLILVGTMNHTQSFCAGESQIPQLNPTFQTDIDPDLPLTIDVPYSTKLNFNSQFRHNKCSYKKKVCCEI